METKIKKNATVFEMEFLMWYYSRHEDFPGLECPAGSQAASKFLKMGLILNSSDNDIKYEGNYEALKVYIKELSKINFPKKVLEWKITNN